MGVLGYNLKVERADGWSRAMQVRSSENTDWTAISSLAGRANSANTIPALPPIAGTAQFLLPNGLLDGVYEVAPGSMYSPNAIRFQPFGGTPGVSFGMRVWGWGFFSNQGMPLVKTAWVPKIIAEFTCWTSNTQNGPLQPGQGFGSDEYLCDTIVLSQGLLGVDGWINSTGARDQGSAGSELPAEAKVCLNGAKYIQFDFKQIDQTRMNCFWAFS